jgi:hypothetical protein
MAFLNSMRMGILPGEWEAQGRAAGNDWQSRLGGLLSGDNALFNLGIGILANNNSNNLSEVLGRGVQQGLQQTQQVKQLGLQNRRLSNIERRENRMDAQLDADLEQTRKRNEAIQRAIEKNPELADLYAIDPKAAIKQAFPAAGDPTEYGLVPQKGINPKTGNAEMFIQDKAGNTKWLGIVPPPDYQVFGATEYTGPYAIDKRNPSAMQNLPMPGSMPSQMPSGYGMPDPMPTRNDPRAPWANVTSPKQVDEVKARTYTEAQKQLDEINAIVRQGGETQAELQRFLDLNRKQATGSLADRTGLPTLDSEKREMEAIQARLAPRVREPGSGTTSDRDIALYLQGLPGVDKPGDVNTNIVKQYKNSYDKALEKQSFYNAYLQEYGHLNGAAELFERDYALNHSGKKSDIKAKPQNSQKKSTISNGGWSATKVK